MHKVGYKLSGVFLAGQLVQINKTAKIQIFLSQVGCELLATCQEQYLHPVNKVGWIGSWDSTWPMWHLSSMDAQGSYGK